MRQVLCPILVGRDEEMELLAGALKAVRAGHGGAVFVLGKAGIGKSRLAREVGDCASWGASTAASTISPR
jgi:MoxR-like ATPase